MKRTPYLLFFFVTASSAFAQGVSEKIDVSIVNVDVAVTSKGASTSGLSRNDFEVFEDGVARPITNFNAVEPAGSTGHRIAAAPAPAASTLADPQDERFRRKVLVIVDNRHVTMYNRDRTLEALERFVDDRFTGGTYDWSIALLSDKTRIVLPLTSDKERLHNAIATIRKIVANPERYSRENLEPIAGVSGYDGAYNSPVIASRHPANEVTAGEVPEETRGTLTDFATNVQVGMDSARTTAAIRDAVRSFAGVEGRKIILLLTGGIGLDSNSSPLLANPQSFLAGPAALSQGVQSSVFIRDLLIREANASDVSFFIVNTEGFIPATDSSSHDDSPLFSSQNPNQLASMYWLARETGGRLMPGNSPDVSLAEFERASYSFYSLAFKPLHGDDGRYHSIKVRIRRPGYQLQYRTGYSSVPVMTQLARAMDSPLASSMQHSSIPVSIFTGEATPHDGGIVVPLQARVAAKDLQFIPGSEGSVARVDLLLSVFDDHGRRVVARRFTNEAHANHGTESNGDFVDTRQILIKRGVPYRVVVAVHDQVTDAIGISSKTVRF